MTATIGPPGIEPPGPNPSLQLSPARGERAFGESARLLAGLAGAVLGWRPDEFWRATPAELAAVLEAMGGGAPEQGASGEDLERLMRMFPDETKEGPSRSPLHQPAAGPPPRGRGG